jgi:tetratricopeptide (TPR) repeat protein
LKSIVIHSKLNIDSREFYIHTGSVPESKSILSEVFEKGKFIASKELSFRSRDVEDQDAKQDYLKCRAEDLHKDTIEEVNMLFYIQSKIRPLKLYLAHFKLGSIFYYRSIISEAINNFQQTIELKRDFIPAYMNLGKCFMRIGEYKKAVETLKEAYRANSEYPDLANSLGVALTFMQEYQKATSILQQALKKNPDYAEANFNLGVALFRSTVADSDLHERAVIPSRVIRYIKSLKNLERYRDEEWQETFEISLNNIMEGNLPDILSSLEKLQLKLITYLKIDTLVESFYLRFMYGGRELDYKELEDYEDRILKLTAERQNFADYWNEMGTVHIIQCRHLFLQAVREFEKAVELNKNYTEAIKNLKLVGNIKKGFLILLRAILK